MTERTPDEIAAIQSLVREFYESIDKARVDRQTAIDPREDRDNRDRPQAEALADRNAAESSLTRGEIRRNAAAEKKGVTCLHSQNCSSVNTLSRRSHIGMGALRR
jgi:hypothetical protein